MNRRASLEVGNARLLQLADILDVADEQHAKNNEPLYRQGQWTHMCGTPGCALGHWAHANQDRWTTRGGNAPVLSYEYSSFRSAEDEFCLVWKESSELFDGDGCGNAKTSKEAAAYIRDFVKRRQEQCAQSSN